MIAGMAAKALMLLILALGLGAATGASAAGFGCGEYETIIKNLAAKYDEAPVSMGVTANGTLLQVLASPDGETWTVLLIHPTGISCITATGEHWEAVPLANPGG